jgi:hypothetical protein
MVISHLTELGPINASLHAVGSSLFYNNHLFSNLLFDYKINQPYLRGFNSYFDLRGYNTL